MALFSPEDQSFNLFIMANLIGFCVLDLTFLTLFRFAQLKLKKNLRKREKRKERIREMKAGTYIPQKKVKNK